MHTSSVIRNEPKYRTRNHSPYTSSPNESAHQVWKHAKTQALALQGLVECETPRGQVECEILTRPPLRPLSQYKTTYEDETLLSSKKPMSDGLCDAIAIQAFKSMRDSEYLIRCNKSEKQLVSIAISSLLGAQTPDISGRNCEVRLGNALKAWRNNQSKGSIMDLCTFIKADSFSVDEYLALDCAIKVLLTSQEYWVSYQ